METVNIPYFGRKERRRELTLEELYVPLPSERYSIFQNKAEERMYYLGCVGGNVRSEFYESATAYDKSIVRSQYFDCEQGEKYEQETMKEKNTHSRIRKIR